MALMIEVEVKNVYGNELIYPVNDGAKILAAIAGKKTLSPEDLKNANKLGCGIFMVKKVPDALAGLCEAGA